MKKPVKPKDAKTKTTARRPAGDAPRCGLCGKQGNLTRTECCDQWICDDEENYVVFSYARNSCHRNHSRFTLCSSHCNEGHKGRWQDCQECRANFPTEIYVWYGTNEYNFEKLPNPPAYEPTRCDGCKVIIKLSEGGYSQGPGGTLCGKCTAKKFRSPKLN